ncbi:alpha/beta hydrolase [Falsibacillus albus]|uniref:Alpha/beta hydrolase n=1 Tax=Falsibacillus albus TaxID=2478915 RepID=A0A3L7JJK3_9BACI|nr:alpha/beta hydrolase [Falsibacillus albus]RLQ90650.1 alpha/beta hydrolase [Falsibacillus albus]
MKKAIKAVGGAALVAVGLGLYISNRLMYYRKKEEPFIYNRELEAKRIIPEEYESLPKEEVWIPSSFGYMLKAVFIKPHSDSRRFMIFSHGVSESKTNSIKYMNLFIKKGFNAVLYDHRRHGESGGKTSSYGHYEKNDLKAVVDELLKREGEGIIFGIHGESMGAVTALMYAGTMEDRADFYIADCPFSDFRLQISHQLQQILKIPANWLLPLADFSLRLRDGYSFKDVAPIQAVEHISKPVLFIHSQLDTFILPAMTEELYRHKKGPKKLFLAEYGGHAQSLNENPAEYEQAVDDFLDECVFKKEES